MFYMDHPSILPETALLNVEVHKGQVQIEVILTLIGEIVMVPQAVIGGLNRNSNNPHK